MEIIRGINTLSRSIEHPVVTIGNFDGVHLGHREIISQAITKARARGGACVAYTFRPHPQAALKPEAGVQLLTTYDEKLEELAKIGVDFVIEEPFSREFSTIGWEQFFNDVLLRSLSTEAIVVGYDFSFGKERGGHIAALEAACRKSSVDLTVVPPWRVDGEIVSSSKIRQHLLAGEIEIANGLLGSAFFYRGVVIRGEGRGRKLGFPTANLKIENKLALPYGVYATVAFPAAFPGTPAQTPVPSVTNVGVRPTFQQSGEDDSSTLSALVETHLIGVTQDLYGKPLEVRFLRKLRAERRFKGMTELKEQISLDIAAAGSALKI
ncbi:MAG: riboflavin biosynthesis protein RibF [Bdellovibrionales bacterium GWB1_55_8]|nr:MAG: riboflavin biosynthesis protein RibF [Bdellovibrionales bacterium GWB1_55_8]